MPASVCDFTFLQGVKVVDFTQFEAGPSCTEALGWLGADVVKIENPKMGDPGRRLRPGQPDKDPYYFHVFNANKKSITVNLKSPKGLDLVKDMIRKADVMIENFAPGAIERLGLSYDVVKAINPGIIYAQVKGFGEGSPFEQYLAFDMIAQACGGTFSVTGDKNGPPTRPGISLGDTGTGMVMAITILGALYKRRETGEGHRLQVAMQDAIMHYMRINFATQGLTGKAAERGGSKVPGVSNAPMGAVSLRAWRAERLCLHHDQPSEPGPLGPPAEADRSAGSDRRQALPDPRRPRRAEAEVDEVISAWTRTHTKLDAMKLVGEAGIPAGAVLDTDELNKDVTFEQRGIMQTMIHPVHRPFKMPAWPVRVDGKATRVKSSPMLGEHTDQVLSDWLGLNAPAVAELKSEGVV